MHVRNADKTRKGEKQINQSIPAQQLKLAYCAYQFAFYSNRRSLFTFSKLMIFYYVSFPGFFR